jgi:catechol 2,3-dioxygenase-like lactoylglutathione lyase family enzyme
LVGFVTARDLGAARAFYGDLLGLERVLSGPLADVYEVSGARLMVVRVDEAEPTELTVFGWNVDDLRTTVAQLREAGVELILYPGLEQDSDLVWTSPGGTLMVWFRDPEGHNLSVMQSPS